MNLLIPNQRFKKKLGQVDQAGAEALIVAYLVAPRKFRSLFLNKIKPHVYVAMRLYQDYWASELGLANINEYLSSPIKDLKTLKYWKQLETMIKNDEIRYYLGKKICHSSNYGIKGPTLQMNILLDTEGKLVLSLKECKIFLDTYLNDLFCEIPEWHRDIENELNKGRVLKNLFGDVRRFHGPWGYDLFKQAYAFKPQSTVGCITNDAICEIQEELDAGMHEEWGLDLLQNGHDSCLFQFYPEHEQAVCKRISMSMQPELTGTRGEKFNMRTECQTGWNWGPRSVYNVDGLEELILTV